MKRMVIAVCTAAMALATPVTASADSAFYYDEKGIIHVKPGTPNWTPNPKIVFPDNPFADDAPNTEQIISQQYQNKQNNDNTESITNDEFDDEDYYADLVDYTYVIVAVNPKIKRYMARSVDDPKKNVIFLQDDVITTRQLKKGEKVILTFDGDLSNGTVSERKDGLICVTPKKELTDEDFQE